ncbi:hypothetical protein V8E36_004204 [Tilletia maclaganii]
MSGNRNLDALLRWSIENDPQAIQRNAALLNPQQQGSQQQLATGTSPGSGLALHPSDPVAAAASAAPASSNIPQSKEEVDAILAALAGQAPGQPKRKSEADLMVEQMAVAMGKVSVDGGKEVDHDDRVIALDNFEMLIESIDNANLLLPLKLWDPLFSLLHHPTSSYGVDADDKQPAYIRDFTEEQLEEIQAAAAWIIGTAVQNNPKCQTELLTWGTIPKTTSAGAGGERPVTTLLRLLLTSRSTQVRNKCAYAISALLKHYPAAVRHFSYSPDQAPADGAVDGSDQLLDLDRVSCLAGWGADWSETGAASLSLEGAQAWFAQHGHRSAYFSSYSSSSSTGSRTAAVALNGWTVLAHALLDPSMLVRRKVAFLINSLLLQYLEADPATSADPSSGAGVGEARPTPSGAPAELPPETMRAGSLSYEGVLSGLVQQGVMATLLLSLLPESEVSSSSGGSHASSGHGGGELEPSMLAGPNRDEEPRKDEDYPEKAARAALAFGRCVERLGQADGGGAGSSAEAKIVREAVSGGGKSSRLGALLARVSRDLDGPTSGADGDAAAEGRGGGGARWEELGLDRPEVESFRNWVGTLGA